MFHSYCAHILSTPHTATHTLETTSRSSLLPSNQPLSHLKYPWRRAATRFGSTRVPLGTQLTKVKERTKSRHCMPSRFGLILGPLRSKTWSLQFWLESSLHLPQATSVSQADLVTSSSPMRYTRTVTSRRRRKTMRLGRIGAILLMSMTARLRDMYVSDRSFPRL